MSVGTGRGFLALSEGILTRDCVGCTLCQSRFDSTETVSPQGGVCRAHAVFTRGVCVFVHDTPI